MNGDAPVQTPSRSFKAVSQEIMDSKARVWSRQRPCCDDEVNIAAQVTMSINPTAASPVAAAGLGRRAPHLAIPRFQRVDTKHFQTLHNPTGMHPSLVASTILSITGMVLRSVLQPGVGRTAVTVCFALLTTLLFSSTYAPQRFVATRAIVLGKSLLAWQIVFAILLNASVTVWGEPTLETVAGQFAQLFYMLPMVLAMDFCNSSQFEARTQLALFAVFQVHQLFGALYVWEDRTIFSGFWLDSASGLWVGGWTVNEVRRVSFTTLLFLVLGSIKDELADDRNDRMLFVKQSRLKVDLARGEWSDEGMRETKRRGPVFRDAWNKMRREPGDSCVSRVSRSCAVAMLIHPTVWCVWLGTVSYWLLALFRQTDKDAPWLPALFWALAALMTVSVAINVSSLAVRARFRCVASSFIAWQVVGLMIVNLVVSVKFPDPAYEQQELPSSIILFLAFSFTVVMDVSYSNKAESMMSMALCLISCMLSFVGNQYFWADAVVFEGWAAGGGGGGGGGGPAGGGSENGTNTVGAYTKNEIRRGCVTTLLFLLVMSFKDCVNDPHHRRMYFVRDNQLKADLMRAKWLKAYIIVRIAIDAGDEGLRHLRANCGECRDCKQSSGSAVVAPVVAPGGGGILGAPGQSKVPPVVLSV